MCRPATDRQPTFPCLSLARKLPFRVLLKADVMPRKACLDEICHIAGHLLNLDVVKDLDVLHVL